MWHGRGNFFFSGEEGVNACGMGGVNFFFSGEEGVVERMWHGRGKFFFLWRGGRGGTHVAWEG